MTQITIIKKGERALRLYIILLLIMRSNESIPGRRGRRRRRGVGAIKCSRLSWEPDCRGELQSHKKAFMFKSREIAIPLVVCAKN